MFCTGILFQELRVLSNRYGCVRELGDIMNRVSFRNGETGIPPFKKLLFCLSNVALGDVYHIFFQTFTLRNPCKLFSTAYDSTAL